MFQINLRESEQVKTTGGQKEEEFSNMGPKDWLAQANRLALDAASQAPNNLRSQKNKHRRRHNDDEDTTNQRQTMSSCSSRKTGTITNITLTRPHVKLTTSWRALGSSQLITWTVHCAMFVLLASGLLANSLLARTHSHAEPGGSSSADKALDPSIELKQQMELIRGASSIELGRSNALHIGQSSASSSNLHRAQRSELSQVGGAPTCGYPGSPAHASVTFNSSSVVAGTAASYTCDNGYELLGPPRRVCQSNGSWLPVGIPFCVLNVGLGKAAMQSSTAGQGSAQRAVDGSTSPYFQANTCTMTDAEQAPWWYVNLLEPYLVQIVRIDFGMACCAKGQKATIAVRVGNNRPDLGNNPLCNRYTGHIEEGKPLFLPCTRPAPGAFVSIHLESPSGSSLSICETFIYTDHALSIEQCPSFRDQPLGSTATYNGKCYLFHNNQALPFEGARKYCEQRGGSLVDETSPALQGFLSWELYRRHRNDQLMGQYWLGAIRDTRNADNWKWINGKDVQITFWNSLQRQGNCSRFDGSKGWLWSDADCQQQLNFICQYRPLSCGKPEKPTNSTLITKNIDNGTVIEYQCAPGNLLMGPKSRTCLPTGFFSEFAPKCKYLDCQFPAHIQNGDYRLLNSSTAYQSVVTYYCSPGYQLYGRATLTCDVDERWNGPPPRCEPLLCSAPVPPTNGYVTVTSNVTVPGTQASYECRSGYELVGERHLACSLSGSWDHSFPYCRVDKRLSLNANTGLVAAAPKVHFPQSTGQQSANRGQLPANQSPNATAFIPSLPPPSNNNNQASLNGLPGQFMGAGQAAVATQLDSAAPASSTPAAVEPLVKPSDPLLVTPSSNRRPPGVQLISSSSTELPPVQSQPADIATSTQSNNLKPAQRPQQHLNRQQQFNSNEISANNANLGGQIATTNSISVHPPSIINTADPSSSQAPANSINQQQQQTVSSILASSPTTSQPIQASSSASSTPGATSFSAQSVTPTQHLLANLPTSSSTQASIPLIKDSSSIHHHHPHSGHGPTLLTSSNTRQQGPNILASSTHATYGQPARSSQNSLASTKYSLDGIIATAIFGGFIFLGAVITIIVVVLRRRKNGHSPSIDAQTICTFDSNGGENNGFYRNYQQAWENLRFATAPGVQPKSSGTNPQQQHHHQLQALQHHPLKSLNDTLAHQAQLHHAHLVVSNAGLLNGGGGGSSQSSSLGESGGAGSGSGNDPLIQHNNRRNMHSSSINNISNAYTNLHSQSSHQLRAAQRRSLQLSANAQQMSALCSDDDDEQGVLSADESAAMHRRQYRLSASTNAVDGNHHYVHTNEGFRDSNELTVGPDTRSVNTNNRGSRAFAVVNSGNTRLVSGSSHALHHDHQSGASGGNNNRHQHHHQHHALGSQHQRLVSSSTATTTSSPSTSTRSSRASPEHSDDVDLDRLAYGSNWQQCHGGNTSSQNQGGNNV